MQLRTVEELWWKIKHFEAAFGRAEMDRLLSILVETFPGERFYSYAIHHGNREFGTGQHAGDQALALHSGIEENFADFLADAGKMLTKITPRGWDHSTPSFDPNDAYHIPLGHFGSLRERGPEIEIWSIEERHEPEEWSPRRTMARAYIKGAATMMLDGKLSDALALSRRSLQLFDQDPDTFLLLGDLFRESQRFDEAADLYRKAVDLDATQTDSWFGWGAVLYDQRKIREAAGCFQRTLQLDPDHLERAKMESVIRAADDAG